MNPRRFPPPWTVGHDTSPTALRRERIRLLETGRLAVKAFLFACLAAIVLAAASWLVLNDAQEPADRAFATPPYTRVGD